MTSHLGNGMGLFLIISQTEDTPISRHCVVGILCYPATDDSLLFLIISQQTDLRCLPFPMPSPAWLGLAYLQITIHN